MDMDKADISDDNIDGKGEIFGDYIAHNYTLSFASTIIFLEFFKSRLDSDFPMDFFFGCSAIASFWFISLAPPHLTYPSFLS